MKWCDIITALPFSRYSSPDKKYYSGKIRVLFGIRRKTKAGADYLSRIRINCCTGLKLKSSDRIPVSDIENELLAYKSNNSLTALSRTTTYFILTTVETMM